MAKKKMNKLGRIVSSLYFFQQGVRFVKIFALIFIFGFASWRVIDGAHTLFEKDQSKFADDFSDLFSTQDPLTHLRALLLYRSHCQVNQTGDLIKISWLLPSFESRTHEPLYLKKGQEMPIHGLSIEYVGFATGSNKSAHIFLKNKETTLEMVLPIENAPLVSLSDKQMQLLGIRYLGVNLLPSEEEKENKSAEKGIDVGFADSQNKEVKTAEEMTGVLEDVRGECFYFVSSKKPPRSTLFDSLFPKCRLSSALFETNKAVIELYDEKGFLFKIELPKEEESYYAKDYFKQLQLERVTMGAALVNYKLVKTPIKIGRPYILTEKGCFDLMDQNLRLQFMKGELIGQLVIYQGMTAVGTKKEAKFEVIDASRTLEEERILIYEAKRMDSGSRSQTQKSRSAQKAGRDKQSGPQDGSQAGHQDGPRQVEQAGSPFPTSVNPKGVHTGPAERGPNTPRSPNKNQDRNRDRNQGKNRMKEQGAAQYQEDAFGSEGRS